MKKGFRTGDYIILGLEILDGILREFQDVGGVVSASYENVYGFVPNKYKKKNFSALMNRLQREGYVAKKEDNTDKYYSLTDKGKVLARKKGILFANDRHWDKKLWVVIFDIEEVHKNKRNKLREIIKTFGFSMWQKSVWISAHKPVADFYEYLKEDKLDSFVCVFTVPETAIGELKPFAVKVWRVDYIERRYREWVEETLIFLKDGEAKDENKRHQLLKRFYEIILKDPFLPEDFLPENWLGKEARGLFLKLNSITN